MAKKKPLSIDQLNAFKPHLRSIDECDMMLQYAQSIGKEIPEHILSQLGQIHAVLYNINLSLKKGAEEIDPQALHLGLIGTIHLSLCKIINPATPSTVFLMGKNKKSGVFGMLGPVPLVRRLNSVTLLCLCTFLGLFYASGEYAVNSLTINGDILSYEGLQFVFNELVIICLAALGSCFYALFEVYRYISNNSYDPKYDSIYWIRFFLGIVSCIILAHFIFVSPVILRPDNPSNNGNLTSFITYKPLLAFLGGFSARAVHKILNALIEAIETLISGSTRDLLQRSTKQAKAQMQQEVEQIKLDTQQKDIKQKIQSTTKLMELKQQVSQDCTPKDLDEKLNLIIREMMAPLGVDLDFSRSKKVLSKNKYIRRTQTSSTATKNPLSVLQTHSNLIDYEVPDFPEDLDNKSYIDSKEKNSTPNKLH